VKNEWRDKRIDLNAGREIDGAAQIVVAATLSLLCICIAFVPMFGLGGVAGYLFRPLAEAVVFAMIASYLWSRTLVPTMAYYLLRNQTHHGSGEDPHAPRNLNFGQRFQRGFERAFERFRVSYIALLRLALEHRRVAVSLFLLMPVASFLLVPYLGENFFPDLEGNAIKLHVRAHPGTRIEEVTRLVNEVEDAIRTVIPPREIASTVDNIGLPTSGINMSYNNSGTIGIIDVDILIALEGDDLPTADYIKTLREVLPRKFPAATFAFLPADMVSQILNFGAPAPIDVQITGPNMVENRSLAAELLAKINHVPGIADARIQQAFQAPALNVEFNRVMAGTVGLTEHDAATTMQNSLAGSSQTTPTYWLNPANGVSYAVSVQTPQYRIDTLDGLKTMPVTTPGRPNQLLGGSRRFGRGPKAPLLRITTSGQRSTSMQPPRGVISAASPPMFKRSSTSRAPGGARAFASSSAAKWRRWNPPTANSSSVWHSLSYSFTSSSSSTFSPGWTLSSSSWPCRTHWRGSFGCCSLPARPYRCLP
jgi:multidrug efflux pump subunit AcrB